MHTVFPWNFLGSQKIAWLPSGFSEPKREPGPTLSSGSSLSRAGSVPQTPLHWSCSPLVERIAQTGYTRGTPWVLPPPLLLTSHWRHSMQLLRSAFEMIWLLWRGVQHSSSNLYCLSPLKASLLSIQLVLFLLHFPRFSMCSGCLLSKTRQRVSRWHRMASGSLKHFLHSPSHILGKEKARVGNPFYSFGLPQELPLRKQLHK